jgi:type IV pilus assembly protein PilW
VFADGVGKMRRYLGSILIELMLAVTLGLMLVGFVFEMYLASQKSYRLQIALNHIQDNAKTAIDSLTDDIRKAGHIGCARLTNEFPIVSNVPYSITPQNKLIGSHSELTVRYVEPHGVVLRESMIDNTTLYTTAEIHFSIDDIVVISDCKQADIFQVGEVVLSRGVQMIIPVHPLHHHYEQYAEIGRLAINHYAVAKKNRKNSDGTQVFSLFVDHIKQHKTEWVADINSLQLLYSVNQKGKLTDVPASAIEDWSNVVGVAIDVELVFPPIKKIWHAYVSLASLASLVSLRE